MAGKFPGANAMRRKLPKIPPKKQLKEWTLFKGDTVQVVAGDRDVGKQGKIIDVVKQLDSVIVEDCKLCIKHVKPNPMFPKGGRIHREMPIHYSQVALIDPIARVPTAVTLVREFDPVKGRNMLQRLTEATGTLVPIPDPENPFKKVPEGPYDTKPDIVSKVTWTPDISQCPFPAPFMNELERMRRKNREAQAL